MAGESKKKIAIVGVSSLILVAMVVALTVGTRNNDADSYNRQDVSSSRKAVETLCAPTDYKDVCVNSLKPAAENTSDPKELIEAAFRVTMNSISEAAANSSVLQELEKDPRTKLALDNCKELANRAINDLEKSYNKFQNFEFSNLDLMFADLQTWLSGAVTYQETCLDGFQDTVGDAGEKMRHALNTSMKLTSNGLAMITDISEVLASLELEITKGDDAPTGRRLLSDDLRVLAHDDFFPDWFDAGKRRLLRHPVNKIKPDLVVAKDGSGKFKTINEALSEIPKKSERTFILYIKKGVYEEKVQFNSSLTHLMIIGDGPTKTRITGGLNFIDGTPTYHTATVAVLGDYFIARDIGFENSAGAAKHQAVALRVGADKTIFYNCHMDGYQDTLYVHTYRQFYRNCKISGTIDFIFGDAAAVFQNCTFQVRKPLDNQQCIVTAQGRKDIRQPTGIVIQNCSFVADPALYPFRNTTKSYLGRPWKEFSRTIIMESFIDDLIQPQGWLPWNETFALETLFYTEFNNRGPGSSKIHRIKWPGVKELPAKRIKRFTAGKFIDGETWIPASGIPFDPSFIFPLPKDDGKVKYSPPSSEENKDLVKKADRDSYITKPDSKSDKDKKDSKSDDKDKDNKDSKSDHKDKDNKDSKSDEKNKDSKSDNKDKEPKPVEIGSPPTSTSTPPPAPAPASVPIIGADIIIVAPTPTSIPVSAPMSPSAPVSAPMSSAAPVSAPMSSAAQVSAPMSSAAQVSAPMSSAAPVSAPMSSPAPGSAPVPPTPYSDVSAPVSAPTASPTAPGASQSSWGNFPKLW